jgi:transcriptional regulator with XRE-family HTH domain
MSSKENISFMSLGEAIKARRLELGWTQVLLAKKSKIHTSLIGGIERGQRNISFLTLCKLARALEIEPAELVKGLG